MPDHNNEHAELKIRAAIEKALGQPFISITDFDTASLLRDRLNSLAVLSPPGSPGEIADLHARAVELTRAAEQIAERCVEGLRRGRVAC